MAMAWTVITVLGHGLGLILRDVHRFLRRRMHDRVWLLYLIVVGIPVLLITGLLWQVVSALLTLVIVLFGFWLMVKTLVRGGRRSK